MLICHNPNKNIETDSISHQLATKMDFIENVFGLNAMIDNLFPNSPKRNKFWREHYATRSNVAHGNIDENNSDYRVLFLSLTK